MERKIYVSKKSMILADILLFVLCIVAAICFFLLDIEIIVYILGGIFLAVILAYEKKQKKSEKNSKLLNQKF